MDPALEPSFKALDGLHPLVEEVVAKLPQGERVHFEQHS
jgi:hypothetical protein